MYVCVFLQQEHTHHAPFMKAECNCPYGWIEGRHLCENLTNFANFIDGAGSKSMINCVEQKVMQTDFMYLDCNCMWVDVLAFTFVHVD